jgi:hypothetical protein
MMFLERILNDRFRDVESRWRPAAIGRTETVIGDGRAVIARRSTVSRIPAQLVGGGNSPQAASAVMAKARKLTPPVCQIFLGKRLSGRLRLNNLSRDRHLPRHCAFADTQHVSLNVEHMYMPV